MARNIGERQIQYFLAWESNDVMGWSLNSRYCLLRSRMDCVDCAEKLMQDLFIIMRSFVSYVYFCGSIFDIIASYRAVFGHHVLVSRCVTNNAYF